jgi:hypothetical protein
MGWKLSSQSVRPWRDSTAPRGLLSSGLHDGQPEFRSSPCHHATGEGPEFGTQVARRCTA